ncbi:MAG TPA: hypothetical protein VER33_05105 [Polyangiaceae bacterium]|nr:hypothetical protein [Polyangiaceae bacterium]
MAPPARVAQRFDESEWPFVVVKLSPRQLTDQEFLEELDCISALYRRGQRFGLVVDTRAAPQPSTQRRRQIAARMDQDITRYPGLHIGTAIVASSALTRGAFKALMWLRQTQEPPLQTFADVESGLQWLRALQRKPSL